MTNSSPEAPPAAPPGPAPSGIAKFSLWPLPELARARLADAAVEIGAESPGPEESAYARGYETGYADATNEAGRTMKRAAGLLISTAEALDAARLNMVREIEDSVCLLALAVAKHLVQREIAVDPTVARDLVQRGLEAFPVGSRVEIHLHPDDLAALRSQFGLPSADGRASDLQWIADLEVERGGCTLETPHRVVDGRIETALQDLYQRMRDD